MRGCSTRRASTPRTPGALGQPTTSAPPSTTPRYALVTVVLNTIDDALDRSDPVGTVWTADAVKHLAPLLARARSAGRTVVMTADHGHVVERRVGYAALASRTYRAAAPRDATPVAGRRGRGRRDARVLTDDDAPSSRWTRTCATGRSRPATTAAPVPPRSSSPSSSASRRGDERARPPPAAAAGARVVDLSDLARAFDGSDQLAAACPAGRRRRTRRDHGPTLFDERPAAVQGVATPATLGAQVVASEVYASQRKVAGRLIVADHQVAALRRCTCSQRQRAQTDSHRRGVGPRGASDPAARALGQVQQLLNVEGYPVVGLDPDGQTVVLDAALLREQFGVR